MSNELDEKKSEDRCKFEKLYTQITFLRWIVLAFFLIGAASMGLLFTHLWHDARAFKSMQANVVETRKSVEELAAEMHKLHKPVEQTQQHKEK